MKQHWKLLLFLTLLTLTLACLLGLSASAETTTVNTEADLRDAVDNAESGDTIVIGTSITLTGDAIRIRRSIDLTITGGEGIVLASETDTSFAWDYRMLFDIYNDAADLDVTLTLKGPMTFRSHQRTVNVGHGNNQKFSGSLVLNITDGAILESTNQTCIYINQKPTRIAAGRTSEPSTAVVNLYSGSVTGQIYGYAPFSAGNTTLNMYGGTITTTGGTAMYLDCPPEASQTTRDPGYNIWNLMGGTVTGGTSAAIFISNNVSGHATVNISGTTVTTAGGHTINFDDNSTLNITGGTITNTSTADWRHTIFFRYGGAITISGDDTVIGSSNTGTSSAVFYLIGAATLNISGGTITRTGAAAPNIYLDGNSCNATVTISGGTISSATGNAIKAGNFAGQAAVTVSGGTVTSGSTTVLLQLGTCSLTVSGGTVTSTGSGNTTVQLAKSGASLTVSEGGTVSAAGTAVRVTADNATVTVTGGTVSTTTTSAVDVSGLYTQKGTDTAANRALLSAMNPWVVHGAIVLHNKGTVNISGGVVTSRGFTIRFFAPAATLNVSGGRIDNRGASGKDTIHIGAFEAYQKYLDGNYSATANSYANCVKINVSGGVIEGSARGTIYAMSSSIFTMTGGTVIAKTSLWGEFANDDTSNLSNNRKYQDFAYSNVKVLGGQVSLASTTDNTNYTYKVMEFYADNSWLTIGGTASISANTTGVAIAGVASTTLGGNMHVTIQGTPTISAPRATHLIYQAATANYTATVTIKGGTLTAGTNIVGSATTAATTVKVYSGTFNAVNAVNVTVAAHQVYLYGGNFRLVTTPLNITVNKTGAMEIGAKAATIDDITPAALLLPADGTLFVLANTSHNKPTCYNGSHIAFTPSNSSTRYYTTSSMVYVAQIVGGSSYNSLAAAVSAASPGATIKILCDTKLAEPISVTKSLIITSDDVFNVYSVGNTAAVANNIFNIGAADVTLTLGGKVAYGAGYRVVSMQRAGEDFTLILKDNVSLCSYLDRAVLLDYANTASVTVQDNAKVCTGNAAGAAGSIAIHFAGNVTTGNLTVTGGELHGYDNTIYHSTSGTLNISGGLITAYNHCAIYLYGSNSSKIKTVNISGTARVSSGPDGTAGTGGNIITLNSGTCTLNVNGGTLASYSTGICVSAANSTVNVNGGSITAGGYGCVATAYYGCTGSVINIAGGTLTATSTGNPYKAVVYGAKGPEDQSNPATYNIYGGIFNGRFVVNEANTTVNFYGGRFTATADCADLANVGSVGGTVHVYGGNFTYKGTTGSVFTNAAGNINLQGGYIIRGGQYYLNSNAYDATGVEVGEHIITRFNKGAAVRMSGTTEASGLRFISHVDADTISYIEDTLGGTIVGYHTIVFPAKYLAALGGVVTPENIFATLTPTTQYVDKPANDGKISDGAGGWLLRAALINIKDDHYDWDFACIAYVEYTVNGKTVRQCTAFNAENDMRSVRAVANYALTAYENGTAFFNVTQLGLLNTYAGRTAMPAAPAAAPEVTPEAAPLVTLAMPAAPVSVGVGVKQYL